jgi:MFS family permease
LWQSAGNAKVTTTENAAIGEVDSIYAWLRLGAAVLLSTLGGVGMWSVVVTLPAAQLHFAVDRGAASLPFTLTMIGFAAGGVLMGRLADRFGVVMPVVFGTIMLGIGYIGAGYATSLWQYALAQGVLIAFFGCSATFGPLMADTSMWFTRRRGIAVSICASGNYLAGTIWPPIVQHFVESAGWRATHVGIGIFCVVTMMPLALMLRRKTPALAANAGGHTLRDAAGGLGLAPNTLMGLLVVAGVACCVAMSMPQVHIVAYCGDLGYGVARGAEMLSLMLGFGIISRLASGLIADRIGGLRTLMLGSVLQGSALLLYMMFNGLTSLYVISALFGLFQGGIIPSYAMIVREYFPPKEAGVRLGIVLMSTLVGMALGGWMSGAIFDLTGSYRAAFANGLGFNLLNGVIAFSLLRRRSSRMVYA